MNKDSETAQSIVREERPYYPSNHGANRTEDGLIQA